MIKKRNKLTLIIAAAIALSGCAGTAVDLGGKPIDDVTPEEWQAFCAERARKGVLLETGGFFVDLFVPNVVSGLVAARDPLDNPTTNALNAKCAEVRNEE